MAIRYVRTVKRDRKINGLDAYVIETSDDRVTWKQESMVAYPQAYGDAQVERGVIEVEDKHAAPAAQTEG